MKNKVERAILVASLFLFAAASLLAAGQTTLSTSAVTGITTNWPRGTPASVGLDEETLKNLDADIASGKYTMTDSFRVFRCGMEVFAGQYKHDYGQIYAKEAKTKGPLNARRFQEQPQDPCAEVFRCGESEKCGRPQTPHHGRNPSYHDLRHELRG